MTMRQLPVVGGHEGGFATTLRTDRWWVGPAFTVFGLAAFTVYVTWAGLQAQNYYADPYLSPLYSPVLFTQTSAAGSAPLAHAWFGAWPTWWPAVIPASPALLILFFPGAFRFTCYYYRKAYYRVLAGSPPGCSVGPLASGRPYKGETALLWFQNLHRYALIPALGYIFILYYDAILAFSRNGEIGVGVGSIVLLINATLLAGYTFGCHAFRHVVGGRKDSMSKDGGPSVLKKTWQCASCLNSHHMGFAWASLIWVGLTDLYVRLVASGAITDFNTWT